jgi:hypothetical protein
MHGGLRLDHPPVRRKTGEGEGEGGGEDDVPGSTPLPGPVGSREAQHLARHAGVDGGQGRRQRHHHTEHLISGGIIYGRILVRQILF